MTTPPSAYRGPVEPRVGLPCDRGAAGATTGRPRRAGTSRAQLVVAAMVSLALAAGLTSCTQVAGFSSPSLIRVIDASYIAPPVNVSADGIMIASNIAQGNITQYGAIDASNSAAIAVAAASGGSTLAQTEATLLPGKQSTVFLSDYGAAKNEYVVTVLEDQDTPAPSGHSSFRFLNQAPKTGAIDIYMVPAGSSLAKATPIVSGLAVGGDAGYITFNSQTVTMVVAPAGTTKAKYTSLPIQLNGGEVRTALVLDTELTANPPVEVFLGNDVN